MTFLYALLLGGGMAAPLLEPVPESQSGLTVHHQWNSPQDWTSLNSYAAMAGVAMADYDGDGLLDLFLGSQTDGGALYRNQGKFCFENATEKAGLNLKGRWTTGVNFADVNNDGHPDLFLGGYRQPNLLFLNQGDGTFIDHSKTSGLDFIGATTQASFADFDRDGDLDCYLLTNTLPATPNTKVDAQMVNGKLIIPEEAREFKNVMYDQDGKHHIVDSGQHDFLFENDGKGTFTDVTRERGLYGHTAHGLSAIWWDADNDHWPDLYVANDFYLPDHFWRNDQGRAFKDKHRTTFPHQPWFSMGSDFADLNNDGLFDYFTTDMSPSSHFRSKLTMGDMSADQWFLDGADPPQYMRNAIYLNGGQGHFFEMAQMLGLSSTNWTWSVRATDLDLDGRQDLLFTTGMTRDFENSDHNIKLDQILARYDRETQFAAQTAAAREFWEGLPQLKEQNFVFQNLGGLVFQDRTKEWGFTGTEVSSGIAIGDLDNNGTPDVVVANFDAAPSVYRNTATGKRFKVRLKGAGQGIGVRLIYQRPDTTDDHRWVANARGYLSSSAPEEIFAHTAGASLRVIWPSGKEELLTGPTAGETIVVEEKNASAKAGALVSRQQPFLKESELLQPVVHRENSKYDEFLHEPLLPHRVSTQGPGLGFADLNGDGWTDFLLTGSAGYPSTIGFTTQNGLATVQQSQAVLNDLASSEHLAPLIFDADSDGDLDVFLTAGGTENSSPRLTDHLLLNNGRGLLTLAPAGSLPDISISSGAATAGDFDGDGDLDLFVAGRVSPKAYPVSPRSLLLRNDSVPGRPSFVDITESVSPFLMEPGMVTSALFTEATGDRHPDLILTIEWGQVTLLTNKEGQSFSSPKMLTEPGWFTSISAGDIDHDGDLDYLVGNFGHNTKYHPTPKAPARIYYGDFDGSGRKQIIEAAVKKGVLLPVRGKSCSQNAMPFIRKKFPTYHSFATQKLIDIYPGDCLDESITLEAHTLSSMMLINDGSGNFTTHDLPRIAQVAPTFGSVIVDLNGDTHQDLVLAQNFFGPQRETGRYSGGLGLVLLGDGTGTFQPLWPDESGLSTPGDATALCVVDLNQDQAPDLAMAFNNGPVKTWFNTSAVPFRKLTLRGLPGNPLAIGARVTILYADGEKRHHVIHSNGGYLSQSVPDLFLSGQKQIREIRVRWPNGPLMVSTPLQNGPINLTHPGK